MKSKQKKPVKATKKKLIKVSEKVHRRIKMRAVDTEKDMNAVLERETNKWKKYDE